MKFFSNFIFLIAFTAATSLQAYGGHEGNGGDVYAIEFMAMAERILLHLKKNQIKEVNALKKAIKEVTVESSIQPLLLDGLDKDALNFPKQKKIIFSRLRWNEITLFQKPILVLHEYLGIIGNPDTGYQVSRALLEKYQDFEPVHPNLYHDMLAVTKVFPPMLDQVPGWSSVINAVETTNLDRTTNNRVLIFGLANNTGGWDTYSIDTFLEKIMDVKLDGIEIVLLGQRYDFLTDDMISVKIRVKIKSSGEATEYLQPPQIFRD